MAVSYYYGNSISGFFEIPTHIQLVGGEMMFTCSFDYMDLPAKLGSVFYQMEIKYRGEKHDYRCDLNLSKDAIIYYVYLFFLKFIKTRYRDFVKNLINKEFEKIAKEIPKPYHNGLYFFKPRISVAITSCGKLKVDTYIKPYNHPQGGWLNALLGEFISNEFPKMLEEMTKFDTHPAR